MLFNSYPFLFVFLPALLVVAVFARRIALLYKFVLIGGSLLFYAQSTLFNLELFLCSIVLTYMFGFMILRARSEGAKTAYLTIGILINLSNLIYFKYLNFILGLIGVEPKTAATVWHGGVIDTVLLPLAISFYTFEQIY